MATFKFFCIALTMACLCAVAHTQRSEGSFGESVFSFPCGSWLRRRAPRLWGKYFSSLSHLAEPRTRAVFQNVFDNLLLISGHQSAKTACIAFSVERGSDCHVQFGTRTEGVKSHFSDTTGENLVFTEEPFI